MKYLVLLGLLLTGGPGWRLLTMVHDRNVAVADATAAYHRGEAGRAALAFEQAVAAGTTRQPDPRLVLNLAHAQARAGQAEAARATYGRLLAGSPAQVSSIARQQLAVLAAQRGELAQAAGMLRQALLLDPTNAGARYNYEVVSEYLARRPNRPQLGPPPLPPPPAASAKPKASPDKNPSDNQQNGQKDGTDRQGQKNHDQPAPSPTTPPARRDNPTGAPDPQRASGGPGAAAPGSRQPGSGPEQPLASGGTPGQQRGLDRNSAAPAAGQPGRSSRPGTEAATAADVQLQTQRERLAAMSMSPAQARQLLETLRAQEQQYLQQLTRPAAQKPDPNRPTW